MLTQYLRKRVCVTTTDGRTLIGVLHTADQLLNIVLTSCVERLLAPSQNEIEPVTIGVENLREDDEKNDEQNGNHETRKERKTAMSKREVRERLKAKFASELKRSEMQEVPIGVIFIRGADVVSVAMIDVYAEAAHDTRSWRGMDLPRVNAPYERVINMQETTQ